MKHLAIIADGNRRWATQNNLPIELGYSQGLLAIERICEWGLKNNIGFLTFYCFSTENWGRKQEEIDIIFKLAQSYFEEKVYWYIEHNIRVLFSGRRERFCYDFIKEMETVEESTSKCDHLTLVICIDYGGRDEIIRAITAGAKTEEQITIELTKMAPCPDVILRTGGEYRLSNFMLWQAAYAELFFIKDFFPELTGKKLDTILTEYQQRNRNFGR